MTNLLDLTAVQARAGLAKGDFTSVELTTTYLKAAEDTKGLNNYVAMSEENAFAMAKQSDEAIASGAAGTLSGLPIGVKDLFATKGVSTTACSAILKGFVPPYESTVTANLWADGA